MPIYDYVCGACGHRLEVIHGVYEQGPRYCPSCGADGRMKKAIAAPAIVFKGGGWAKKDRSATATPGTARKTSVEEGKSSSKGTSEGTSEGSSDRGTSSAGGDAGSSGSSRSSDGSATSDGGSASGSRSKAED